MTSCIMDTVIDFIALVLFAERGLFCKYRFKIFNAILQLSLSHSYKELENH